jgi:RNA polymerase sigma factor (sigma-70 family)
MSEALLVDSPETIVPLSDDTSETARDVGALLLAAGEGDQSAWQEIVHRYGKLVAATVGSFRLQDADALDAIQMTWLRLMTNWHRVQAPENLGGWLVTTARRECLSLLRQAATRAVYHTDAMIDMIPDPSSSPEQRVLAAETGLVLRSLVAQLPVRGQTLVQALFDDNPQPYVEIARITGIPQGSMGPTRARALQKLRRMLDERGLEPGVSL